MLREVEAPTDEWFINPCIMSPIKHGFEDAPPATLAAGSSIDRGGSSGVGSSAAAGASGGPDGVAVCTPGAGGHDEGGAP